jgi:hypothetical protein
MLPNGSKEEEKKTIFSANISHRFCLLNNIWWGVEGKVVKQYTMKAYGGVDVQIHIFLTTALGGGELSASRPGPFTPREKNLR